MVFFTPHCRLLQCRRHLVGRAGTWLLVSFASLLWSVCFLSPLQAQTASLRGFITDETDGQALQGVNVVLENEADRFLGVVSDGDGFYALAQIAVGTYRLRASYIGYDVFTDTLRLAPGATVSLNIALAPGEAALEELLVESERIGGAARVTAGLQSIRPEDVELIPAPDVSGDLASYLSTQPGIVAVSDQGGQLFIRGGEPAHNLALLDGMYVFQPFHILSFYSAFPSDILNRADVYAGGYGSKFSGRISSIIDIYSRNGNTRRYAGAFSAAPFVSSVRLEGPLLRDRISFLGSLRQSVIQQAAEKYLDTPLPYRFGDLFGKLHINIAEGHRLSVSLLRTYDRGRIAERIASSKDVSWRNTAYGMRYLIAPGGLPILAELLLSSSRYDTDLGPAGEPTMRSEIGNVNVAVNITNFAGQNEVNWGFYLRAVDVTTDLNGLYQDLIFDQDRFTKIGFYLEPEFTLFPGFQLRPGLAGQLFKQEGFIPEPRLRLTWDLGEHHLSAAAGLYHQEIVGLNDRRDATNVFTAWTDAPSDNLPRAAHLLAGYRVTPGERFEISVEGFYKRLSHLSIEEWTAVPRLTTRLQEASGEARGVDIRIELRLPGFYSFINYGLSFVNYEARQASLALWYGEETLRFRPPHDRRHQVNALASLTLGGIDLSVRWNFGSGFPFSRALGFDAFLLIDGPIDAFTALDSRRVIYERPYNGLLPTYHRLDLSAERTFEFEETNTRLTLQAGVINVYDRANLFALDIFTLERSNQLPVIPTIGLKLEF